MGLTEGHWFEDEEQLTERQLERAVEDERAAYLRGLRDGINEAFRHGRWVKSDIPHEEYVCSECGGACWYYDYQAIVAKSRYCPNCGAKMDLKDNIM